mgnify:CR=1 FL=1
MGRKKANHRFKVYEHNQEASRLNKKLSDLKQLCRAEERKVRRLQDKVSGIIFDKIKFVMDFLNQS